jgi:hypothetical protein
MSAQGLASESATEAGFNGATDQAISVSVNLDLATDRFDSPRTAWMTRVVGLPWSLLVVGLLFIIFGLARLDLPGPYPDEVIQAAPAARLAAGVVLPSVTEGPAIVDGNFILFHHTFPLVMISYLGPVKTYLLAAVFSLFGATVPVMRATTVIVGYGGICFLYLFGRIATGRIGAELATVLVGSDPSFLVSARDDWGPVVIGFALKMLGLYFLARWYRSPRSVLAPLIAGLSFGIGLSHKADFAWFLLAGLPVGLIFYQFHRKMMSVQGLVALAGLTVGALPLISFNLVTGGRTWTGAGLNLVDALRPFVQSTSPLPGLWTFLAPFLWNRGILLLKVLNGQAISAFIAGSGNSSRLLDLAQAKLDAEIGLYVMAIIFAAILLMRSGSYRQWRPAVALILATVGIFFQIVVTPAASGPHHSLAVYPFPQLTIAYGFAELAMFARTALGRGRQNARAWIVGSSRLLMAQRTLVVFAGLAAGLISFVLAVSCFQLVQFQANLARTGGAGYWSDGIYAAARLIQTSYPNDYVETLDWGIRDQLIMLLGARHPVGFWGPGPNAASELDHELAAGKRVFVLHSASATLFQTERSRFLGVVGNPRLGRVHETTIDDRVGKAFLSVINIRPTQRKSLIDDLPNAIVTQPRGAVPPIGGRSIDVGGKSYRVLLQHPTSSVTYHLPLPKAETTLVLGVIIDPLCWSLSDGATFEVNVADGATVSNVFATSRDPKGVPADRSWYDSSIDLTRWKGRTVDLTLSTGPGPGGYSCSWAEWVEPEILSASDNP